jgi:hypothetical protein
MQHLNIVNMTYLQHMRFALSKSVRLFYSSLLLLIHAIFPNLFEDSGSTLVNQVHFDLNHNRKNKNRILVRFNTKWQEDIQGRKWRVLENGVETLTDNVIITIPCSTIQEDVPVSGTRWHFLCYGTVFWNDGNATIR